MDIFKGENFVNFIEKFHDDMTCKAYLSEIKWSDTYRCKKCNHTKFSLKDQYSRVCTKCHHIESPTANTLFHKLKFGLKKAFMITFEMSATTKGISASQVSKRYGITRKTAWFFMQKVRIAMQSSLDYPMAGNVHVDEFVVGGKENLKPGRSTDSKKKKVLLAVELTENNKVKRTYALRIENYSSKSLRTIFEKHISKEANITTDEWTGYKPITKDFNIVQIPSNNGTNFKQLHHIVHQIKSWIRTTYSWTHEYHINKYLDEYSFRINRSIYKETIFHKLITRLVIANSTEYKNIIIVSK